MPLQTFYHRNAYALGLQVTMPMNWNYRCKGSFVYFTFYTGFNRWTLIHRWILMPKSYVLKIEFAILVFSRKFNFYAIYLYNHWTNWLISTEQLCWCLNDLILSAIILIWWFNVLFSINLFLMQIWQWLLIDTFVT